MNKSGKRVLRVIKIQKRTAMSRKVNDGKANSTFERCMLCKETVFLGAHCHDMLKHLCYDCDELTKENLPCAGEIFALNAVSLSLKEMMVLTLGMSIMMKLYVWSIDCSELCL